MRAEILRIQQDLKVTTIYVTHDQTEAMTLGDTVAVLNRGVLQQLDAPQVLYARPANIFVAGFIGSPAMNMVEAKLTGSGGDLTVELGPHRLKVPADVEAARPGLARYVDRPIVLGIRPEHLHEAASVPGSPPESRFPAVVDLKEE